MLSADAKPFVRSAAFYDLIYANKPYDRESANIAQWLSRPDGSTFSAGRRLIEWAAGTGEFTRRWKVYGWDAIGIEPCSAMSSIAAAKGCKVRPGDICSDARDALPLAGAAVCLFGSFSYAATDNDKLRAALRNVRFHLSAGARFVFDVLNLACASGFLYVQSADEWEFPDIRNGYNRLRREMRKTLDVQMSLVNCEIDYQLYRIAPAGTGGSSDSGERWTEHHSMRAFSPPELAYALADAEFAVVAMHDPETGGGVVRNDSYYVQLVAEAC